MTVALPTVTIVMPNFNHGGLIGRALGSALAQTVAPLEILVIDDGSTDDSVARIEAIARDAPLIRLIRHERNLGVVAGMNRGLAEARGDFVLFAAADDHLDVRIVERSMTGAAACPDVGITFSDFAEVLETGETRVRSQLLGQEPVVLAPVAIVELSRKSVLSFNVCNNFFNRSHLQAANGFDPELRWKADAFVSYALALRHGACYVPDALAYFRRSGQSYSSHAQVWATQSLAVRRWFETLEQPEWGDVRELMLAAGILPEYSIRVLTVAARHRSVSMPLLGRTLYQMALSVLAPVLPTGVRRIGQRLRAARRVRAIGRAGSAQ